MISMNQLKPGHMRKKSTDVGLLTMGLLETTRLLVQMAKYRKLIAETVTVKKGPRPALLVLRSGFITLRVCPYMFSLLTSGFPSVY